MIKSFGVKNYKSILEHTIELGRLNVFIGENGCGKTNILEAVATAAAAVSGEGLDADALRARGVRVARHSLTFSSFLGHKPVEETSVACVFASLEGEAREIGLRIRPKARSSTDWSADIVLPPVPAGPEVRERVKAVRDDFRGAAPVGDRAMVLKTGRDAMRAFDPALADHLERDLGEFVIYNLSPSALRGLSAASLRAPLGVYGESLDVFLSTFKKAEMARLFERARLVSSWVDNVMVDVGDELKFKGYKPGRSNSILYFRDRFMRRGNNIFSVENANEGILHVIFYLALFMTDKTPRVFGVDNIETALNPQMCRDLIKELATLAREHDKQALITTHNPAVLDGLNLHDDEQRLFVVSRNDHGHTVTDRIKVKPQPQGEKYKLSELWMRGHLGGLPRRF